MTIATIEGRPAVELFQDRVTLWVGEPDAAHGVALHPAAAVEAAKDMLALALPSRGSPTFTSVVEGISIRPPAGPDQSGILTIRASGDSLEMLIGWADLCSLAETARMALDSAEAVGEV